MIIKIELGNGKTLELTPRVTFTILLAIGSNEMVEDDQQKQNNSHQV